MLAMTGIGGGSALDLRMRMAGAKGERIATASLRTGFAMTIVERWLQEIRNVSNFAWIGGRQRFGLKDADGRSKENGLPQPVCELASQ